MRDVIFLIFFASDQVKNLKIDADIVVNPVPAANGLIFTFDNAFIDSSTKNLNLNITVSNYTNVVVKDISLNALKIFNKVSDGYTKVASPDSFEKPWIGANLAKESNTSITIPLVESAYNSSFWSNGYNKNNILIYFDCSFTY